MNIYEVAEALQKCRHGKKVVSASGSFDIIHPGHINFFAACKEKGDILVVGVSSDLKIKKRKGDSRPVMSEKDRVLIVSHLDMVNFAFVRSTDREETIRIIRPDILIFNADVEFRVEQESRRAKYERSFPDMQCIFLRERDKSTSSTKIIQRILDMQLTLIK